MDISDIYTPSENSLHQHNYFFLKSEYNMLVYFLNNRDLNPIVNYLNGLTVKNR